MLSSGAGTCTGAARPGCCAGPPANRSPATSACASGCATLLVLAAAGAGSAGAGAGRGGALGAVTCTRRYDRGGAAGGDALGSRAAPPESALRRASALWNGSFSVPYSVRQPGHRLLHSNLMRSKQNRHSWYLHGAQQGSCALRSSRCTKLVLRRRQAGISCHSRAVPLHRGRLQAVTGTRLRQRSVYSPTGARKEKLLRCIQGLDTQRTELLLLHDAHSTSDQRLTPAEAIYQPAQASLAAALLQRLSEVKRSAGSCSGAPQLPACCVALCPHPSHAPSAPSMYCIRSTKLAPEQGVGLAVLPEASPEPEGGGTLEEEEPGRQGGRALGCGYRGVFRSGSLYRDPCILPSQAISRQIMMLTSGHDIW